jgi:hypothetical protein
MNILVDKKEYEYQVATTSTALKEILLNNLSDVNLAADVIDSNQFLYPQLKDAEILD